MDFALSAEQQRVEETRDLTRKFAPDDESRQHLPAIEAERTGTQRTGTQQATTERVQDEGARR